MWSKKLGNRLIVYVATTLNELSYECLYLCPISYGSSVKWLIKIYISYEYSSVIFEAFQFCKFFIIFLPKLIYIQNILVYKNFEKKRSNNKHDCQ